MPTSKNKLEELEKDRMAWFDSLPPHQQAALIWFKMEDYSEASLICLAYCFDLLMEDNLEELRGICEETLKNNSSVVSDYFSGKKNAINSLIGVIVQKTGNRFSGKDIRSCLLELCEEMLNK